MAAGSWLRAVAWVAATVGAAACQPLPAPAVRTTVAALRPVQAGNLALAVGEEKDLLPFIRFSDTGLVPIEPLAWTISNPALLTIDAATGRARAIASGTVVATAQVPGQTQGAAQLIIDITATSAVREVVVAPAAQALVVGDSIRLVPTVRLPDGQVNQNVFWASSDNTVAVVNPTTGEASALKPGRVTIIAAYALDPRFKGLAELTIYADRSELLAASPPPPPPATPEPPRVVATPDAPRRTPRPSPEPDQTPTPRSPSPSRPEPTAAATPFPAAPITPIVTPAPAAPPTPAPTPTPVPTPAPTPLAKVLGTYAIGNPPHRLAFDKVGNAWVTNGGSRSITKLSADGATRETFDLGAQPRDVAIDSGGNAWVTVEAEIVKLSPAGATLLRSGFVVQPHAIAIDADDDIWVSDHGGSGDQLVKLTPEVENLGTFGVGHKVVDMVIDGKGHLWCAVGGNTRAVVKLDAAGAHLGSTTRTDLPATIALDPLGGVWIGAFYPGQGPSASYITAEVKSRGGYAASGPLVPGLVATDVRDGIWAAVSATDLYHQPADKPKVVYPLGFRPTLLAVDRAGNPWVGSADGKQLLKLAR